MKKPNLQQALFTSGLIEKGNLEEIEVFKKEYRAEYLKKYQKDFREKTIRYLAKQIKNFSIY